jgi:hypothetical protein
VGVEELDEEYEDCDTEDDEAGDADLDPEAERGEVRLAGFEAVIVLFDGEACAADLFGELGDLSTLLLELAVKAGMGFGDLTEIASDTFGHGYHGGFGGLLGGGSSGEVPVGHGDEAGDVGEEFEELGDELRPHIRPS